MNTHQEASLGRLEKSLIAYFGVLILSLLIIFAVQPSIYTMTLSPGLATTERYPLPAVLFLVALLLFVSTLMYGIFRRWRWLFWLLLAALAGSVIQIPVELLQLAGMLPNPFSFPIWYSLFRTGVGIIELGFVVWMIQTYRHHGVWAMGKKKKTMEL